MKPYHTYIGIDRSDETIDYCQLTTDGEILTQKKISSSPESLLLWVEELRSTLPENATIALCIVQPCQNLVHFFSQFQELAIYLENPAVIKKYRESLSASRAKDDKRDAAALAQYIFERHRNLSAYSAPDPLNYQISLLVEKRRQLVGTRTSLTNKLTQNYVNNLSKFYLPDGLSGLFCIYSYASFRCLILTRTIINSSSLI